MRSSLQTSIPTLLGRPTLLPLWSVFTVQAALNCV